MGINVKNIGLTGLVTANDILNRVGPNKEVINNNAEEKEKPATSRMEVAHSSNGRYVKLSKSKRSEANFLYSANRDAVVSQASVMVPTQGIISACADNPELAEKFSAIIILETSRLLKNYTSMTSVYDNGQIFEYDSINVGYALSIDDGLKVPVFKNSDQKSLESLISEKEKFIEKYISRELSIEDLSGGTFTITDLSSTGCYLFNPVLNLGQSVILGVGGENPSHTDYPLILAYDHRVVDGATATEFLCALRERLMSHETVLLGRDKEKTTDVESETIDLENLCCDSCYRSIDELEDLGQYLLKTIDKTGHEKHICSICMGGW
jgi:pyruvate/2-oxoglutarate dehydrogenase complex dihydrolipoamide acyltransferase (E2) component